MNNHPGNRIQHLREAFAGIISMMLGLLRAHGLRGLLYLPEVWLASREIKRIGEAFCEMFAAWSAGLVPPAAPPNAPQSHRSAPAQSIRAARRAAPHRRRPRAPTRARRRSYARLAAPAPLPRSVRSVRRHPR